MSILREIVLAKSFGNGGEADIDVQPLSVTENGDYNAPTGTAYSPVTVNVPTPTPALTTKTITENGTYAASTDNADGYSEVTVNVEDSGGRTLTKLASVTITEPVSYVAVTATDAMKSCDRLYIRLKNVALSAADWIYPYINGVPGTAGSTQMGYITTKAATFNELIELIAFGFTTVDGKTLAKGFQYAPQTVLATIYFRSANALSSVGFRTYTSSTTFNSGIIDVWGYVE